MTLFARRPSSWQPSSTGKTRADPGRLGMRGGRRPFERSPLSPEQRAQGAWRDALDRVQAQQEAPKILVAGRISALQEHVGDARGGEAQAGEAHIPPEPFPLLGREFA